MTLLAEMETFPSTEHGLVIAALLFVGFIAARAWTQGVLKLFWAIVGLAMGAAFGYLFFQHGNAIISRWFPGRELGLGAMAAVSFGIALVAYIIFRQMTKSLLQKLFNADGMLSGWAEGFRGALLSLVPSLITIFILLTCLRMGGTLMELRSAEKICEPEVDYTIAAYPGWSWTTAGRDALERLPYVVEFSDPIDPISRPVERTLVMLLIASKKSSLFHYLKAREGTSGIVNGALFQGLLSDPAIGELLAERKHVALLRHPAIVGAAENDVLAEFAPTVDVRQAIDDFMLSEERQKMIQDFNRRDIPAF